MKVKVTLVKSLIGRKPNQVATAKTLKLTKIGDFALVEKNDVNVGKINTIRHLLKIEEK